MTSTKAEHIAMRTFAQRVGCFMCLLFCLMAGSAWAQVPTDPFNYSRSSSFEYDPTTGLITSETVEPDNIASCVKTAYSYINGYGNKTSATTANCAGTVPSRQQFTSRS